MNAGDRAPAALRAGRAWVGVRGGVGATARACSPPPPPAAMSKIAPEVMRDSIEEILNASKEKQRKFLETIELQVRRAPRGARAWGARAPDCRGTAGRRCAPCPSPHPGGGAAARAAGARAARVAPTSREARTRADARGPSARPGGEPAF